ncbi:RCC1 domain-containing protein [Paraliomyxa miuraensis]|uniref:RCC1 domain-containing protein n=1 Tax=Paraliomyxa miuraensis TaxID=376150 RepID=UPI002257400D|nr:hypothetical protein [Paraliomyxa miuraensis]MCX4242723.1 hypothetical protein [Paraliomyxa miuraensis]
MTSGTDDSSSGSSTGMASTTGTTMVGTTLEDDSTTSSGSTSSSSSGLDGSSTGPICTPGELACACDDGACSGDLSCIEGVCTVPLCGNGAVDAGEACDDGNRTDGDGCQVDCTVSPGAAEVVAGDEHVCARWHTGAIKCWGVFTSGRLGYAGQAQNVGDDETPADRPFVDVGAPVTQLALGPDFTCALLDTAEVKCWGVNLYGQLGQGHVGELGLLEEPAAIAPIDFGADVPLQIAAGGEHACAVMQSGALRCWGRNDYGQIGLPGYTAVGDDELPSVVGSVDLGGGVMALQVATGLDHTCALLDDGGVLCFGRDSVGQLGTPGTGSSIGDNEVPSSAARVMLEAGLDVTMIAARHNHTCVAYDDQTLHCWGEGGFGRLGYGDTSTIGDGEEVSSVMPIDPIGSEPTSLGMGMIHTCVRLASAEIYCWGEGANGRLGYGNTTDRYAPTLAQVVMVPPQLSRMVTAGRDFSCGTTMLGQVKCWGRNDLGQLGYGAAWTTDLGDNEPIDSVGPVKIE